MQNQLKMLEKQVEVSMDNMYFIQIRITVQFLNIKMIAQKPTPKNKKPNYINFLKDRTRLIPFQVPTKQQRQAAIGSLAGQKWRIKKTIQTIWEDFQPIKKPELGNFLFQYESDAEPFGLFASKSRNHIDVKNEVIYIATVLCKLSEKAMKKIKKKAKAFFHGIKVKFFTFQKLNLQDFNPIQSPDNDGTYYDAAKLNIYFSKKLPKNTYSVAILTNILLYNGDNPDEELGRKSVYGLGSVKDRMCIISYEQCLKKGYGNLKQQELEEQSQQNLHFLIKIVNHELCHTFAIRHCIYYECLMNGSSGYQQAQTKEEHLCPVCLRKLHSQIGFDFVDRYEALGDQKSQELASKINDKFMNMGGQ